MREKRGKGGEGVVLARLIFSLQFHDEVHNNRCTLGWGDGVGVCWGGGYGRSRTPWEMVDTLLLCNNLPSLVIFRAAVV